MSGRGRLDEAQGKSVIRGLQHVESLSEAQVTKNIHGKVVAPIAHVSGACPTLGLDTSILTANLLTESADISEDVSLHLLHGTIREGMGQDTALPGVELLVTGVVGVGRRVDKGVVELGLADIGAEAVDLLERSVGVEAEGVGAKADNLAILLVHAPELEMSISLVCMVELVGVGDLGEEGAGILGERVKEDSINNESSGLWC